MKERRKRAEAAVNRVSSQDRGAQDWTAAFDAEPYVVVSLLDDAGGTIANVEGNAAGEDWTVVVDQAAVAGSDDEFVALEAVKSNHVPTFLYQVHDDLLTTPSDVQAIFDGIATDEKQLHWIRDTTRRWDGYLYFQRDPSLMLAWFKKYLG